VLIKQAHELSFQPADLRQRQAVLIHRRQQP
jgi:hypothetical protein